MKKLFLALCLVLAGCGQTYRDQSVEILAFQDLDVNRYLGLWYEIARYPNWFERGCEGVTAEYALREDGQIAVTNSCRRDGETDVAEGVARIEGPGELTVTFTPWLPFARGDYWVLWVDAEYQMAVVGNPAGRTGWILARTPEIDVFTRAQAEAALRANGYDISGLEDVVQP